jgi:hypothetical protein
MNIEILPEDILTLIIRFMIPKDRHILFRVNNLFRLLTFRANYIDMKIILIKKNYQLLKYI